MKSYLLNLFSKFLVLVLVSNILYADGSVDFDKLFDTKNDSTNTEKTIESKTIPLEDIEKAKQGTSQIEVQKTLVGIMGKSMFSGSSSGGIGFCYAIKNEDSMNSCIANAKKDIGFCYGINNNDLQNSCIANIKRDVGFCYAIKSKDLMNGCIANIKREIGFCYSIKSQDLMNSCISEIKRDKGFCYSIKSQDLMNNCISNF